MREYRELEGTVKPKLFPEPRGASQPHLFRRVIHSRMQRPDRLADTAARVARSQRSERNAIGLLGRIDVRQQHRGFALVEKVTSA